MRRKDREVTDVAKIEETLAQCTCCRVGFCDDGEVYIVPLNFGYEKQDDTLTLWFHGAAEGRKYDLICQSPQVGFEMDTAYKLNEADVACGFSARFRSIIGNGRMTVVEDAAEKQHGLTLVMEHATGKRDWAFDEKALAVTAVFKLEVTQLSCKEHE